MKRILGLAACLVVSACGNSATTPSATTGQDASLGNDAAPTGQDATGSGASGKIRLKFVEVKK